MALLGAPSARIPPEALLQPESPGYLWSILGELGRWAVAPRNVVTNLITGDFGEAAENLGYFLTQPLDAIIPGDFTRFVGLTPQDKSFADALGELGFSKGRTLGETEGRVAGAGAFGGSGALLGALVGGPAAPITAIFGGLIGAAIGALAPPKNLRELFALPLEVFADPITWTTFGAKGLAPLLRTGQYKGRWLTKTGAKQLTDALRKPVARRPLIEAERQGFKIGTVEWMQASVQARKIAEHIVIQAKNGGLEQAIKNGVVDAGGIKLFGKTIPTTPIVLDYTLEGMKRAMSKVPGNATFKEFFGIVSPEVQDWLIAGKFAEARILKIGIDFRNTTAPLLTELNKETVFSLRKMVAEWDILGKTRAIEKWAHPSDRGKVQTIEKLVALFKETNLVQRQEAAKLGIKFDIIDQEVERFLLKRETVLADKVERSLEKLGKRTDRSRFSTHKEIKRLESRRAKLDERRARAVSETRRAASGEEERILRQAKSQEGQLRQVARATRREVAALDKSFSKEAKQLGKQVARLRRSLEGLKRGDRGSVGKELRRVEGRLKTLPARRSKKLGEATQAADKAMAKAMGGELPEMLQLQRDVGRQIEQINRQGALAQKEARTRIRGQHRKLADVELKHGDRRLKIIRTQFPAIRLEIDAAAQQLRKRQERVLQTYSPEMRRFLQRLETDEKFAQKVYEEFPQIAGPNVTVEAGAGPVEIGGGQFIQSLLDRGGHGGFGPGALSPVSPTMRQRKLAVGLVRESARESSEHFIPIGVKRALLPHEIDPLIGNLERYLGKQRFAYKIRDIFSKQWADSRLRPAQVFEDNPLLLMHKSFQQTAHAVGNAEALNGLKRTFGRAISAEDIVDMASNKKSLSELYRGWVEITDIKELKGYRFPADIAVQVRRVNRHFENPEVFNHVLSAFDRVQGWWKAQALLSPAYHSRNFISGVWQAFVIAGMNSAQEYVTALRMQKAMGRFGAPGQIAGAVLGGVGGAALGGTLFEGALPIIGGGVAGGAAGAAIGRRISQAAFRPKPEALEDIKIALPMEGKTVTARELWEESRTVGIDRPGWMSTELDHLPQGVTRIDEAAFHANVMIGNAVEENLRLALYINLRKRGYDVFSAGREVARTHFIYSMLAPAERAYLRRLIPFYTWVRFNLPATIEAAVRHPGKFLGAKKVIDHIQYREEMPPPGLVPEWMLQQMGVRVKRDKQGRDLFFLLGNWWPAADVLKLARNPMRDLFERASPFIRLPAEMGANQHLGTGWPIEKFPGEVGQWGPIVVEKRWIKLLQSVRFLNDMERIVGPAIVKRTAERGEKIDDVRTRLMHWVMGLKVHPVNRLRGAQTAVFRNKEQIGKLRSAYMRAVAREDTPNISRAADAIIAAGAPLPTEEELIAFKKRSTRLSGSSQRDVERILEATGFSVR